MDYKSVKMGAHGNPWKEAKQMRKRGKARGGVMALLRGKKKQWWMK